MNTEKEADIVVAGKKDDVMEVGASMKAGRYSKTKAKYNAEIYNEAISWIAAYDNPNCLDMKIVVKQISVQLVSALLNRGAEGVALDVIAIRKERLSGKAKEQ